MLAGKSGPVDQITYPVLATPKLDGIRCLVINGRAVSRTFKPIPNKYIRATIEMTLNSMQLDGEILVKNRTFNELSGDVRREDGRPDFVYAVFDYVTDALSTPYVERMARLCETILPAFCKKILPVNIKNAIELAQYEQDQITLGYEGVMIRTPNSPYKCGRSSTNEGYLLKIKRFEDSEGYILTCAEMMHNDNVATRDAFGRTERSSNKENLRPAGVLGKLVVKPLAAGPISIADRAWLVANLHRLDAAILEHPLFFGIGTGYDAALRATLWTMRDKLSDKIVKFKHQPSGADVKPRFPVFLGFRDAWDM
jgi:DNA ligase-1